MYLIAGLGNPGKEYEKTRHNAGFLVLDALIKKYNLNQDKDKYNSLVYKGLIADQPVIAIKPMTFMNNSGKAISAFVNFYKISPKNVVVLYDEIMLTQGKVRLRVGGSDAGHNGIKSINSLISNDYIKIKIGVGHPGNSDLVTKYVLHNFSKEELNILDITAQKIAELFKNIILGNHSFFSSEINQV